MIATSSERRATIGERGEANGRTSERDAKQMTMTKMLYVEGEGGVE